MAQFELVYALAGYPGHGKTTISKALERATSLPRGSTSDIIYPALAEEMVANGEASCAASALAELKIRPKEEIRSRLVATGDRLTKSDPSYLLRTLVKDHGCRAVDGVRRVEEFREARQLLEKEGLFIVLFWIKRSPEPARIYDNTTLTEEDADAVIINEDGKEDAAMNALVQSSFKIISRDVQFKDGAFRWAS